MDNVQIMSTNKKEPHFNAEEFVEKLLTEGALTPCDDTAESFRNQKLPLNYDDERYKRGQDFFYKHIFGMYFSKFLGLITILAVPTVLHILMYTKMSGSVMSAYRRYLATVFHMKIWYDKDFRPGSKAWESINEVKNFHNSASTRSCNAGLGRISQKDMAATQFGFMGYAVIRSKQVGIHDATEEEFGDFIYVWRTIGCMMGIEDRFNICRESVEETRQICELLVKNLFKPKINEKGKDFKAMSKYLVEGMWSMNPLLSHPVILYILYDMVNKDNVNNNDYTNNYVKLNFWGKLLLGFIRNVMYYEQYKIVRLYFNYTQYRTLFLMKYFPFLAIYRFGWSNSYVKIFTTSGVKSK